MENLRGLLLLRDRRLKFRKQYNPVLRHDEELRCTKYNLPLNPLFPKVLYL